MYKSTLQLIKCMKLNDLKVRSWSNLVTLSTLQYTLQMTSKTKKPELSVISGCLEGLASCLVNFTEDEGR